MKTQNLKTIKLTAFTLIFSFVFASCSVNHSTVSIPAKQKIVVDYPNYSLFSAKIKNQSFNAMEVKVLSKDLKQVRGFGLSAMGNAKVMVEKENQLVLVNNSDSDINVKFSIKEESPKVMELSGNNVSFTLENNTDASIPLWIPSVMNPNLSPKSKSGVELKYGQKIYFRDGLKKYVLLEVDEKIAKDSVINVAQLLANRKKDLDI